MSVETRKWRLVCYDIREPKRYRKAYKLIRGRGERLQYSLFRCLLDDREAQELRWELSKCLAEVDSIAIIDLCNRCADRAVAKNELDHQWETQPASFRILREQAHVDGHDEDSEPDA